MRDAFRDLSTTKVDWTKLNWYWLIAAGILYGLGTVPGGLYWHMVLIDLGQRPELGQSLRAFFTSQLGKYVPGKGMVIVMRTMAICGPRVRVTEAVTSVFVETLTWMAVGAAIGSLLVVVVHPHLVSLAIIASVVALCSLLPISPPFLSIVLRRIAKARGQIENMADVRSLGWMNVAKGWMLMTVGWLLVAASLWAVIKAFPGTNPEPRHFAVSLECVTLAVVLGFASMLPGGLGVRELVIVPLLRPEFGAVAALACAILVRVIWLISESAIVGIIQIHDRLWLRHQKMPPKQDGPGISNEK